jgi:hypothetical protein
MKAIQIGLTCWLAVWVGATVLAEQVPPEPLEIGHDPQFVFDLQVVDTTWGLKPKGEPVKRVLHQPVKHPANPLITGDDPSHLWVLREADGKFRMWYQANVKSKAVGPNYDISVAYAESSDGIHWEKPALDLFPEATMRKLPRNAVLFRSDAPQCGMGAPQILDLPEKDRRGFRYVMLYLASKVPLNGIRLIGSQDGIHWEVKSDTLIAKLPSDTHNTIVYDPQRDEYVMFCRSKNIYHAIGQTKDPLSGGESRRGMSRMSSKSLWTNATRNWDTTISWACRCSARRASGGVCSRRSCGTIFTPVKSPGAATAGTSNACRRGSISLSSARKARGITPWSCVLRAGSRWATNGGSTTPASTPPTWTPRLAMEPSAWRPCARKVSCRSTGRPPEA